MFRKISQNSHLNTRRSHPEVFCQKMFLRILYNLQKNIFVRVSFLIKLQPGNLKLSQAAIGDALQKKVFFKISQISWESTCTGLSF